MRKLPILILALALLAAAGCSSQAMAPSATVTPAPTPEPTWAPEPTVEKTAEPTTEATAAPSAAPAVSDFAGKEVNLNNVEAAVEGFFLEGEYKSTDVTNSGGIIYVTITYMPATYTEGNDFAVQVGFEAARVMQVLFSNPAVNVVTFKGDTAAMEGAMEISMSKESVADVDWDDVIYRAQTDYKALLDVAGSYNMGNSISDKLK
jgi:hypothetical protein